MPKPTKYRVILSEEERAALEQICRSHSTGAAKVRKARILLPDTTYIRAWQPLRGKRNRRPPTGDEAFCAQNFLIKVAEGKTPSVVPQPVSPRKRKVVVGKER